jgi:hypothetical protein
MRTVLISLISTLLFVYHGSSNALAPFDLQAQRLVSLLAWIWPILPIQYELVRQVQGVGQSTSYAFMCAALWAWPIGCAVAFLRGHANSQKKVLSISPKEIGQFLVALPFGLIFLAYDVTEVDAAPGGSNYDATYGRAPKASALRSGLLSENRQMGSVRLRWNSRC